jgi:DNA-binding CsgD family transcriptional regulator
VIPRTVMDVIDEMATVPPEEQVVVAERALAAWARYLVLVASEERPTCEALLTVRERDVMRCVEEGLSNAEIARELWIQPTTVRKHLENIFAKLGVRNRTAALSKLRSTDERRATGVFGPDPLPFEKEGKVRFND